MDKRIKGFYKKERTLCIGAIILGLVFASQYFFANQVENTYRFLFYTLTGYGIIYIFNYGRKWWFFKEREKNALIDFKQSPKIYSQQENDWITKRRSEYKQYKIILEVSVFIGVLAFIIALTGFNKALIGGTGIGVMMGSGFWLCIELLSEFQCREYEHFVEKHR